MSKINIILCLILSCLIVLGILLRAVEVINGNYLWGFDHGREYLMTKEIVVDHHLRLIGTPLGGGSAGIQGIFHGPLYYYFLAIPFILFSHDPYGGVVLMFIFGLGAICMGFLLGKKMLGLMGGLLVAALLSLSPPIIAQSRAIWSPFPSTFFVVLSLYFTFLINTTKGKKNGIIIFLSAFFAAFVYNFELAIALPLSLGLLIYSIYLFKRKSIIRYLYLFSGFVFALLPMIFFEIRHNFMAVHGLLNYLFASHPPKNFSYLNNLNDHFQLFLYNISDTFPHQQLFNPIVLLVVIAISVVIIRRREKRKELKDFITYLLFLPFVTFFVLSFLRNAVYPYYLFHLNVVYILLISYCFYGFIKTKNKIGQLIILCVLLVLLISAIPTDLKMIRYDLTDYGGTAKIKGKEDALDYIYKDAQGKHFNLLVFSPPVYTYPYDYLEWWYGQKKYGYTLGNQKKGTFYLLMEPDPAKPWSYKGWLATVIKTGKVIKTVNLPSGFIVQKRIQK